MGGFFLLLTSDAYAVGQAFLDRSILSQSRYSHETSGKHKAYRYAKMAMNINPKYQMNAFTKEELKKLNEVVLDVLYGEIVTGVVTRKCELSTYGNTAIVKTNHYSANVYEHPAEVRVEKVSESRFVVDRVPCHSFTAVLNTFRKQLASAVFA